MKLSNKASALLLLAAISASALSGCGEHEHSYYQTVVPPTCQSIGYTINTCSCGESYYSDYRATTAHEFGDWIAGQEATLTEGGEEYCICGVCGRLQTRDTENHSALPKLYLTSISDDMQTADLLYSAGETLRFSCQAILTVFGTGVKPNFDLQLVADDKTHDANPVDLGWGEQSRYRLSACLPDRTFARTAAAHALWQACLAQHTDSLSSVWNLQAEQRQRLLTQVYLDGHYLGLYAILPPETDWAYALTNPSITPSAALRAMDAESPCSFQSSARYTDARGALTLHPDTDSENPYTGFAFLNCTTESTDWACSSFSAFSSFVRHAQDTAFHEQLSQYTDPEVLLDYFLLSVFFGCTDGDTIGTVWYTGDGIHWLPTFSEAETAYGLSASGSLRKEPNDIPLPEADPETISYAGTNQLWDRLTKVYAQELRERYAALRETLLDPETLYASFLDSYQAAEAELYAIEYALYPSLPVPDGEPDNLLPLLQTRIERMDLWLGYSAN